LVGGSGASGMIVPHSAFCTDRMLPIQGLFYNSLLWVSSYDVRPAKLFNGVEQRLAVYLQRKGLQSRTLTTKYNRWNEEARDSLFESLRYHTDNKFIPDVIVKNQSPLFDSILKKISVVRTIEISDARYTLYYHNAPRYWIRATKEAPYFYNDRGGEGISTQVKQLTRINDEYQYFYLGLLNSSLFYLWFIAYSDSRHLNAREIQFFPTPNEAIKSEDYHGVVDALMSDYERNKHRKETVYANTGRVVYDEYYPKLSKPIIDQIDTILAKHYGFTEEELDYIINYDIKYRMGLGGSGGEDGSDE